MKLSKKFIGVIAFSFLSTVILVFFILRFFTLKSFNTIEMNNSADNMTRVINYISDYTDDINALCLDYSRWDDTYSFINNHNKDYIESNFNDPSSFIKSGADFIIYADNSGKVIFKDFFNDSFPLGDSSVSSLIRYSLNTIKNPDSQGVKGLHDINGVPAFLSINPILRSDNSGPRNGVIICGDFVDYKIMEDIYKSVRIDVSLSPYKDSDLAGNIYGTGNIRIYIKDKSNITAVGIINDIDGMPFITAKADVYRNIYLKAGNNFYAFGLLIFIIGFIASLAFFILMHFLVVKRLENIKNTFDEISTTEDLSIRVKVNHHDEITALSKNFNFMLDRLQKSREKIYKAAYFDSLTELPNRKKLAEDVSNLVASGTEFSVFYIDLDNFKNINDSLGHDVGDVILKKVSKRLQSISHPEVILGRIGGDEFILINKECNSPECISDYADKICNVLSTPIVFKSNEFFIKASMGITTYPEGGTSVSALMKNADTAMYAAKASGGAIYKIYTKDMNENSLNNLIMENSLRKALDNDEFFLEYQPIFDCNNLNILGTEVLCRWRLDNNIIPPGNFIPLAKKIGEITRIDNWVLKQACCQCREWHDKGLHDLYISVNVSFKQLRQSGFLDYVIDILNKAKLDPKYLNLEITEDEAMADPAFTIEILQHLRNMGVQISIDDFGSGYSSLSYINRLPLNTIKIDKSLIDNINDRTNLEIIRSVITLADSLSLNVVSEGIELDVQYAVLRNLNCKSVQGFLFSKPLAVDKFQEKFIRK